MKHPLFSILFLSAALVCLLPAFGTKPGTGKLAASAAAGTKADVSLPAANALTCSLPAPSSFTGERTSVTAATLEWSSVSSATSYRLLVYDNSTNALVSNTVEHGTSASLTGLTAGVAYRCVLASMCSGGTTSDCCSIIVDILT